MSQCYPKFNLSLSFFFSHPLSLDLGVYLRSSGIEPNIWLGRIEIIVNVINELT